MTSIHKSIFDIFEKFPQYRDEFIVGLDLKKKISEQERYDLRDRAKIFIIIREFPSIKLDGDAWMECFRLNGHDLERTTKWLNNLIDVWNKKELTLPELMYAFFESKIKFQKGTK